MTKDKTRIHAYEIIYEVRYREGYLNKLLQGVHDLSTDDMRLLTTLTYGVIKKYEYLKTILFKQQENLKLKKRVEVILVIALYQKLFLKRIPEYAIINSSVEITKTKINAPTANFVNALLRKMFEQPEKLSLVKEEYDDIEYLAIEYSIPQWLMKLFVAQYDEKQLKLFLETINQPAKHFIRLNRLKENENYLAENQNFIKRELPYCYENIQGNSLITDDYQKGILTIQNISSQSVSYFVNPQQYDKILDMCAAPGGKTTHLAELTNDTASIIALDIYPYRVKQIEENQERLGINGIRAITADALNFDYDGQFDKVLLDAPCSGFGVMAQKPEIRYTIAPENLDELVVLQRSLLEKAWTLLTANGELIYSTCTINRKENEKQVEWFLTKYSDAKLVEERLIFDEMSQGYSGFYMAKIQKI